MDIESAARTLFRENRRETGGHTFTIPSPETYPYQWLWDSCFHAIMLARFDSDVAKEELRSLVAKQFGNGMLPHMIYWEPGAKHWYQWGLVGTSSLTQPPMFATALERVYEATKDESFLRELFHPAMAYYEYLVVRRDPHRRSLLGIVNPDESGEDNSPRFDSVLKVPIDITEQEHIRRRVKLIDAFRACGFDEECAIDFFWVEDVGFNAIAVANLDILARIADVLGERNAERWCLEASERIRCAMRERMLADGVYWSIATKAEEHVRVPTWGHFMPLYAGLYTPEEAQAVVETYLRDEAAFRAPFGVRTVAKSDPSYAHAGFWRGPIWMAPHWFIHKGLIRYGFDEDAKWVKDKSELLLRTSGFREYYDPETGSGYGADNFTWGALALDMV